MGEFTTAADLLRKLREERGGSLRATAQELGLAPSQLSRLERGQRGVSEALASRLASYYEINSESLTLAEGQVPADVIAILMEHPEEIDRLREKYSANNSGEQ